MAAAASPPCHGLARTPTSDAPRLSFPARKPLRHVSLRTHFSLPCTSSDAGMPHAELPPGHQGQPGGSRGRPSACLACKSGDAPHPCVNIPRGEQDMTRVRRGTKWAVRCRCVPGPGGGSGACKTEEGFADTRKTSSSWSPDEEERDGEGAGSPSGRRGAPPGAEEGGSREAPGNTGDAAGREGEDAPPPAVSAALSMLKFYKREISPFLPGSCRYVPSCSTYSMIAFQKYGFWKGGILTAWRLLRCNPLGGTGFDPPRWFGEPKPPPY